MARHIHIHIGRGQVRDAGVEEEYRGYQITEWAHGFHISLNGSTITGEREATYLEGAKRKIDAWIASGVHKKLMKRREE